MTRSALLVHLRRVALLGTATGLVWTASSAAQQVPAAPALSVHIDEPSGGIVDAGDLTVGFSARVSDPTLRTALLSVNGASYEVPVEDGRIEQRVIAVPGNNRVGVVVRRGGDVARDSITFHLQGGQADLIVLVGWQSRGEIIDLWVREPDGETCKWDHRETTHGGSLLDFSGDAIGFGSEAYVRRTVSAGRYRIKVHYWGAYGSDDGPGEWALSGMLDGLDQAQSRLAGAQSEAERERLRGDIASFEQRLDRWALPAGPQTPVHAEAILFPGTRHERRWRFDLVVQRTGQLLTLGEVEVTDEMIRAAHAEAQ